MLYDGRKVWRIESSAVERVETIVLEPTEEDGPEALDGVYVTEPDLSLLEAETVEEAKEYTLEGLLCGALERFISLNEEAAGNYGGVPPNLLNAAFMAHFFFFMEGRYNPDKARAAQTLLGEFRTMRRNIESKTEQNSTPAEIMGLLHG
jgi:hypothetical protein